MPLDGAAELARFRPATASGGDVQAVDRSAVGGESARYRRVSPPERAVVLCVDEKSQVQALDRAQPLVPMRPGQAALTTTRGTTSLFAALDVKAGTITGKCMPRHRASEFRKYPDEVERSVPEGLDVHIVMDNVATHKTKPIRDWLAKRPRRHVHFTPTSALWINQVERFFAVLTERALRAASSGPWPNSKRQSRRTSHPPTSIPNLSHGQRLPITEMPFARISARRLLPPNGLREALGIELPYLTRRSAA